MHLHKPKQQMGVMVQRRNWHPHKKSIPLMTLAAIERTAVWFGIWALEKRDLKRVLSHNSPASVEWWGFSSVIRHGRKPFPSFEPGILNQNHFKSRLSINIMRKGPDEQQINISKSSGVYFHSLLCCHFFFHFLLPPLVRIQILRCNQNHGQLHKFVGQFPNKVTYRPEVAHSQPVEKH